MTGLATRQFDDAVTVNRVAMALRDLDQRQGKGTASGQYRLLSIIS